jgi:hypothetical protein
MSFTSWALLFASASPMVEVAMAAVLVMAR